MSDLGTRLNAVTEITVAAFDEHLDNNPVEIIGFLSGLLIKSLAQLNDTMFTQIVLMGMLEKLTGSNDDKGAA